MMEERFKKFIYSGLGLLSITTNKIKETVEELVRDQKISEEEGKRIVDDLLHKSKEQRQEYEEQFRSFSSKFSKTSSWAEQEIEKLRKRIEVLEEKHNIRPEPQNEPSGHTHSSSPAEKVEHNERVSLGDEVLTPEKKMEAEQNRMQEEGPSSADRQEQETQKTNLGGPILSPEKKVDQDSENRKE